MDYKDLVKRIDEMEISARDRAAAKAQLAHAERLVDWAFAAAGGLRRATGTFTETVLGAKGSTARRTFDRPRTA